MTQRLLNFKRQLELRSKMPVQSPSPGISVPVSTTPQPVLAYNQPIYPNDISKPALVTQNGVDSHSTSAVTYDNDNTHSPKPIICTAVTSAGVARAQQPIPQFVSSRHVLLTNESRLLSNAQLQESPTISEYPTVGLFRVLHAMN